MSGQGLDVRGMNATGGRRGSRQFKRRQKRRRPAREVWSAAAAPSVGRSRARIVGSPQRDSQYFATCHPGLERALYKEIVDLSRIPKCREGVLNFTSSSTITNVSLARSGVSFSCNDIEDAYRCVLWLRSCTRMMQLVATIELQSHEDDVRFNMSGDVYGQVRRGADWSRIVGKGRTFQLQMPASRTVYHQGVLTRTRDAICDAIVNSTGSRPVKPKSYADADIPLIIHIYDDMMYVYRDLSGQSLHKRGYRGTEKVHRAQLNECAAAGILIMAGWNSWSDYESTESSNHDDSNYSNYNNWNKPCHCLVDPFCGSGTILIEAAMMRTRIAPGYFRSKQSNGFAFTRFEDFNQGAYETVIQQCEDLRKGVDKAVKRGSILIGNDVHSGALSMCQSASKTAGVETMIHLTKSRCEDLNISDIRTDLIVSNPPWGKRLDTRYDRNTFQGRRNNYRTSSTKRSYGDRDEEHSSSSNSDEAWQELRILLKSKQCSGAHARLLAGGIDGRSISRRLYMKARTNNSLVLGGVKCCLMGYDCYERDDNV